MSPAPAMTNLLTDRNLQLKWLERKQRRALSAFLSFREEQLEILLRQACKLMRNNTTLAVVWGAMHAPAIYNTAIGLGFRGNAKDTREHIVATVPESEEVILKWKQLFDEAEEHAATPVVQE
eukprot:TRINITY_DN53546_c0_g1_i2.p3 TRINITY_DN53546_c0_g1~~TRINITY_DN53546_c0_g1_i2.p3  ORF type:complete len:122 (+),score=14.13 TRINITY_DN53546_c0_g1_i2:613-978(+)